MTLQKASLAFESKPIHLDKNKKRNKNRKGLNFKSKSCSKSKKIKSLTPLLKLKSNTKFTLFE